MDTTPPPRLPDDPGPGDQDSPFGESIVEDSTPRARTMRLSDVEAREVDWLWPGRLPAGMISILDGYQKIGKSTVVLDLVARITTGRPFPNEIGAVRGPADVVLLGHEDSPHHTIRPRMDAAGADPTRVHLLTGIGDGDRLPQFPGDVDEVERVVRATSARLLVIDPISAYLGGIDFHKDNEVRAALAPLAVMAERTGVAVLMLRHLRKSGGVDAINRGLGSVAIAALARAMLMLLKDPDDKAYRVLAWPGINVAQEPPSLRLRWVVGAGAPRISWEGTSELSADDILGRQDREHRGGTKTEEAEVWLRRVLADGPLLATKVQELAEAAGISVTGALKRAKEKVVDAKKSGDGPWRWSLKGQGEQSARHVHHAPLAPLAPLEEEQEEQETHGRGTAPLGLPCTETEG